MHKTTSYKFYSVHINGSRLYELFLHSNLRRLQVKLFLNLILELRTKKKHKNGRIMQSSRTNVTF